MQALIFDVDGTLADTETVHLQAFNAAFAEVGLGWYWDKALYTRLLRVAGGKERLMHYWRVADLEEADGASTTRVKKSSPDVYLDVLRRLGLKGADCIAFEDSVNGLDAARAAGIPTVVTPSEYTSQDCFDGALTVLPHLGDPHAPIPQLVLNETPGWVDLATLRRWHRHAVSEAA